MTKNNFSIVLFLIFIVLIGCTTSNQEPAFNFGVGAYRFTMSDSTGNKLADGTLDVKESKDGQIAGSYEFVKIYKQDFQGLNAMDGEFDGNINEAEKIVFINTNPKIADSNVFWNMKIKKNSVSGEWRYSVFRGIGNKGKIRITK